MSDSAGGYPILLHLQDKLAAVIGGGRVAQRKVKRLLSAGARVMLISPELAPDLRALAEAGQLEWIKASYQRDMFNDAMPVLVIAATDDERVNQTVAQDAHRIRALCNVANGSSDNSDFSNMAQIERPPLTVALSSKGASPALVRLLKARLAEDIGDEYAVLADWLGALRHEQNGPGNTQSERQDLYERILCSEVLSLLQAGKGNEAERVFRQLASERTTA